jgi:outer membrane biosynthesis protein TonB
LNFLDGMTGRVALPTGISDLAMLKGQARRNQQGAYQIRLTEDSRGKVVVDDTTFLFQFVAPPPIQPKPQLPVSVTRGATSIDWATTMIAAFSFLLHFSALDPVVDYDVNISSLLDQVKNLPPPPPVEEPTEKPTDAPTESKAAEAPKAAPKGAGKAGPMSEAKAAALSNQLEQMEMATLGALSGAGPATEGVLKTGEVPTGALDKAAASSAGVGVGGLSLGGGGGAIRPGSAGGGLGSIGSTGTGTGQGSGQAQTVQGPKGNASTGAANVSGGTVSNAARVVAGMRAGFRNCYNRALAQNPDVEGRIALSIRVGPGGEVQGVTAAPSGNLPDSVVSCVKARAQAAQFDPPQGGLAVIQVPVTFVKQ